MAQSKVDGVIFLDIDGVLNPQVQWDREECLTSPTLRLTAARLALAQELDSLGQVVWASSWSIDQTFHLGSAIGLPADTPSVNFTQKREDALKTAWQSWKVPFVEGWLRRQERMKERRYQAVVWIDDDLYEDADAWADASRTPTLLIRTDPASGLTASDVARVRSFLVLSERCSDGGHLPH